MAGKRAAAAGGGAGLFDAMAERAVARAAPLSTRLRPRTLDEVAGQRHLVGPESAIRRAIAAGRTPSLVLWGPPGVGKTTIAALIAQAADARFVPLSAVSAGVADLREAVRAAGEHLRLSGQRTVLFVDEIHRFNKAQQDAILPHVEAGTVVLVGATTENPAFAVNRALLSRARVVPLAPLDDDAQATLVARALADAERGLGDPDRPVSLGDAALARLLRVAAGDARFLLDTLEVAAAAGEPGADGRIVLDADAVDAAAQQRLVGHDRDGDDRFDLISALQKSIRGSDPDAAVYYLARLLEGGEDPVYVARRLVRTAAEDVGLADPTALVLAAAAAQAAQLIGFPEGSVPLAELVLYLAQAPKSDRVEAAYFAARDAIAAHPRAPVPRHLRNAAAPLLASLGYGKNYQHAHADPEALVDQQHLPDILHNPGAGAGAGAGGGATSGPGVGTPTRFYTPTDRGAEREIGARIADRRAAIEERRRRALRPPGASASDASNSDA